MAGDNLRNFTSLQDVAPTVLASIQLSGDGDDTIVAPSSSPAQSAILKTGSLCNITADPNLANVNLVSPAQIGPVVAYVSLWVVPNGGQSDGTHRIISFYQLDPGDSFPLADYLAEMCLGPGDALHANVTDVTGLTGLTGTVDIVVTGILNS